MTARPPRRHRQRLHAQAPTIGLIVEGETEFKALPLLHRENLLHGCPPMKATNLNGVGSHLTPVAIAKMVAPKVRAHFAAGRSRVLVCLDREQRSDCPGEFADAISSALAGELAAAVSRGVVDIVIADRAFEAWLLAGASGLFTSGRLAAPPKFASFEGKLGDRQRKGISELERLLGRAYSKTEDGPSLFRALDFPVARRSSKSLDKLLRTLGA